MVGRTFIFLAILININVVYSGTYVHTYSIVPNRRAVRNKSAGGKILKKRLNVQDRIDVQGENFLENQ